MKIDYSIIRDIDINKMKEQFILSEDDLKYDYTPFDNKEIQKYNPIYNIFFNMNESNYDKIGFNHKYQLVDLENVYDHNEKNISPKSTFIKFSPLLDPVKYLIGKYDLNDKKLLSLPNLNSTDKESKLNDPNNSSYVDCFFSFLSSKLLNEHNVSTCIDFYGSFLTVQRKFKFNIADDFEYLSDSKFFMENMNKIYDFSKYDVIQSLLENNSRKNKNRLCISDDIVEIDIEELDIQDITTNSVNNELEEIYNNDKSNYDGDSDTEKSEDDEDDDSKNPFDDSDGSNSNSEDDDDSDSDGDISISSEISNNMFAYINNFPTQMICLEKCDNTLDSLFESEVLNDDTSSAALLQVIMTMLILQKAFHFTHNDLHTNNIVYKDTDKTHLYFKFNSQYYKIPTFGKIFKIIDFGRSIYKYKGHLFCSDSFAPGGDASTQYNFKPYFNPDKPVIEPNYSFDLCRLGCSIYDFIIDDEKYEDMNELQKTIHRWCSDDSNDSILYKENGSERYPNFKLYKMIARNVHNHTPEAQLGFEFFNQYACDEKDVILEDVIDISEIPCYAK
tara:strand:+ start:1015 stop:2691 length:1677 start_codon:yes stop_codon:yes gene_type:complete